MTKLTIPTLPPVDLMQSFAKLGEKWFSLFEQQSCGHRGLTVTGLASYLTQLRGFHQPETAAKLLFPCSFEIYAICIKEILDTVLSIKPERPITVWTILSMGLKRWYNLCYEDVDNDPFRYLTYTRPDWEYYKEKVTETKNQHNEANVQMRRIIIPAKKEKYSKLFVFKNGRGAPINVQSTRGVLHQLPKCVTVLPEIKNLLESPRHLRSEVHLIAAHDERCLATKCVDGLSDWKPLLENFIGDFHTGEHTHSSPVNSQVRGVYCGFVDVPEEDVPAAYGETPRYDDVFVVELPEPADPFGLAFYQERRANFSALRILTKDEITEQLQMLTGFWRRVSN